MLKIIWIDELKLLCLTSDGLATKKVGFSNIKIDR